MATRRDWYLIGWLPLIAGIVSYIAAAHRLAPFWDFFWSCPLTAVILGIALLSRSRLAITAISMWLLAPIFTVVTSSGFCLQVEQFHHFVTVAVFPIILFHLRGVWSTKGALLGITTFSAYTGLTNNLSGGIVNFPEGFPGVQRSVPYMPLWMGIGFVFLSITILLWYDPLVKRFRR